MSENLNLLVMFVKTRRFLHFSFISRAKKISRVLLEIIRRLDIILGTNVLLPLSFFIIE